MKRKAALALAFLLLTAELWISGAGELLAAGISKTAGVADINNTGIEDLVRMDELAGWATVPGEGLSGVTGGGDAEPVYVSDLDTFKKLAGDDIPRVIVITEKIVTGGKGVSIGSNKTIVGLNEDIMIRGNISIEGESNVIVANLSIKGWWPMDGSGDCVTVRNSHHLWFTHLSLWNSWDGNMDITIGSDYITVSWCKFWYTDNANDGVEPDHRHRLSNLIGSGTGHDDTDMGKLRVTYHHNWFADNLDQRMPRVMYGRVHIYNNYYSSKGNNYCIGADCYASLLVENNYFDGVRDPHKFSYGVGLPACIVARGNIYDNTKGKQETGQCSDIGGYAFPFETTVYDYYLNDARDIPELVQSYAGPQDMSDEGSIPEALKKAVTVQGTEDVYPEREPLEEKEETYINDNPVTYDEVADTYTFNGQNSDGSNGFYTIENPFANRDYSETPEYKNGVPVWEKGATISYWVKIPEGTDDFPVLNFNLKERAVERSDLAKYLQCENISYSDGSADLGEKVVYVDADGKEYTALKGYGTNVRANPAYPKEGYYYATSGGGAYRVYRKGTYPSAASNWTYLNYIGSGLYEEYGNRYFEEGGETSKIKEANIKGSFSLYASGTFGYRQDNWTGLQQNPNLAEYGTLLAAQTGNQFYYWGNPVGYKKGITSPALENKGEWHFVAVVIQNDWVQYYIDGIELTTDYLNWWNKPLEADTAGDSFNLGYGQKMNYKSYRPDVIYQNGKTILEFLSDENTVLTIGGTGYSAAVLEQDCKTDEGCQVKDVTFYYSAVSDNCILSDRIDLSLGNTGTEAPLKSTEKVTISFSSEGGSDSDSIQATVNEKAGKLPVPKREGFIFDGWYTDTSYETEFTSQSIPLKNMTLYAKWDFFDERPDVTVRFDTNGGVFKDEGLYNIEYPWAFPAGSLPVPEKEGYIFKGWYTAAENGEAVNEQTVMMNDMTLYARWEKITGTVVSFDTGGGFYLSSVQTGNGGQLEEIPIPTKLEHIFDCWYTNSSLTSRFDPEMTISENMTLYAAWAVKGDLTGDGKISAEDALMVLKKVANMIADEEFTDMRKKQADVNGSGSIEAEDALMILKRVANMITGFDS